MKKSFFGWIALIVAACLLLPVAPVFAEGEGFDAEEYARGFSDGYAKGMEDAGDAKRQEGYDAGYADGRKSALPAVELAKEEYRLFSEEAFSYLNFTHFTRGSDSVKDLHGTMFTCVNYIYPYNGWTGRAIHGGWAEYELGGKYTR